MMVFMAMLNAAFLLTSACWNLHAFSKQRNAYLWLAQAVVITIQIGGVPVLSAAAGDRPAAGGAADREDPAAQTCTETTGATAGGQTKGEAQTQR